MEARVETNHYRLTQNVVCRSTTSHLKMLFDRKKGVMYELNETASSIVALLNVAPRPLGEIVEALGAEYTAEPSAIAGDVERILADFESAGLVEQAAAETQTSGAA